MPRLVKTVTEMEGRFEEKWVLVEEDGIVVAGIPTPSWPWSASPRRARPGRSGSRGVARYTVDVALPGMLHAAVLRSPVARGRVTALQTRRGPRGQRRPRRARPRDRAELHAALRPAVRRARLRRRADRRRRRRHARRRARPACAALALEIEPLPFVVDIEAAFRDQRIDGDPFEESRGDVDAALAAAEVSRRAPGRDARPAADADRAARRGRLVEARRADLLDRDAGHLRRRATS